jgi:hypothetical protein
MRTCPGTTGKSRYTFFSKFVSTEIA